MLSLTKHGSLRGLARWLFLVTLVVTPWFYGGTTAWSIELVYGMLGLALVIWIASLVVDRRWPMVPRALVAIAGLVLLQGWWMVINAHGIYDSAFHVFAPIGSLLPTFPGSADFVLSFAWMLRATALIGVVCLVAELVQRQVWLLRLWYALAIAGASIATLGLLQKATGAQMIFWQSASPWEQKTFFATYFYHSNAGAFLNLVLPVTAGLAAWAVRRNSSPVSRATWIIAAGLCAFAVLSNTSRMAQTVGGLIALALVIGAAPSAIRFLARTEKRTLVIGSLIVAITLLSVAQAVRLDQPLQRWQELSEHLPANARWTANRVALTGLGDAGWLGLGPGVFRAVFPRYQQASGNQPPGTWRFLHDDYLQTLLEWGWMGSLAVAALFFGGIGIGIRSYLRAKNWSTRQRILVPCVILALLGVAIHAAVDFPLQILSIQLFVATYLGICWGSGAWARTENTGKRKRS